MLVRKLFDKPEFIPVPFQSFLGVQRTFFQKSPLHHPPYKPEFEGKDGVIDKMNRLPVYFFAANIHFLLYVPFSHIFI